MSNVFEKDKQMEGQLETKLKTRPSPALHQRDAGNRAVPVPSCQHSPQAFDSFDEAAHLLLKAFLEVDEDEFFKQWRLSESIAANMRTRQGRQAKRARPRATKGPLH